MFLQNWTKKDLKVVTLTKIKDAARSNYQIFITGLGMVVFQALNFGSGLLIARGLGPEGQGKYQLLISITIFVINFAKLGLDEGTAYLIPLYKKQKPERIFSLTLYVLSVTLAISLTLGILIYLGASYLEIYVFKLPNFSTELKWASGLFPILTLLLISMAILRGLERADLRAYIYYYGVGVSFFILLVTFFVSNSELNQTQVYMARIVTFFLGACIALWFVFRIVSCRHFCLDRDDIRTLHSFSGWLVFAGLFQQLIEQPWIDLVIVANLAEAKLVGIYSVAARIGALVALILSASVIAAGPRLARIVASNEQKNLIALHTQISIWMAHLCILSGFGLFIWRYEIIKLFGPEYVEGVNILCIFLIGQILVGTLGLNTPILLAYGYAHVEFMITASFFVLMFVCGMILGYIYGVIGVAIATASISVASAFVRRIICTYLFGLSRFYYTYQTLFSGAVAFVIAISIQTLIPITQNWSSILAVIIFSCVYWSINILMEYWRTQPIRLLSP